MDKISKYCWWICLQMELITSDGIQLGYNQQYVWSLVLL